MLKAVYGGSSGTKGEPNRIVSTRDAKGVRSLFDKLASRRASRH